MEKEIQEKCKVCGSIINNIFFESYSNKSLTTMNEVVDGKTQLFLCNNCFHLQTNELPDVKEFYEKDYIININSDDEDQLYEIKEGKKIYRTEKQAEMVFQKVKLHNKMAILDYGCAKSSTTKLIAEQMKLQPYLYDVTDKYVDFWKKFTIPERWSSIDFPKNAWNKKFDVVLSFYAFEHITDLKLALKNIHESLKSNGIFFFMVPDVYQNAADFIVADHVNHFSVQSLEYLLSDNGFEKIMIDDKTFNSAFVVTCVKTEKHKKIIKNQIESYKLVKLDEYKKLWGNLNIRINEFIKSMPVNQKLAIYGSGFYGAYVYSCIEDRKVEFFLDINTNKSKNLFDIPVILPVDLPVTVKYIIVALNPTIAEKAISEANIPQSDDKKLFYI